MIDALPRFHGQQTNRGMRGRGGEGECTDCRSRLHVVALLDVNKVPYLRIEIVINKALLSILPRSPFHRRSGGWGWGGGWGGGTPISLQTRWNLKPADYACRL